MEPETVKPVGSGGISNRRSAHLAATLGRATWILLPHVPEWRWLLGRDDSPWYATARLFKQSASREYASVVGRIRDELLARIARFEAETQNAPAPPDRLSAFVNPEPTS